MFRRLALTAALLCATAAMAEDLSQLTWTTNYDDPPIGDPEAKRGGTLFDYITAYPLTMRLVGPNSNDAFASWKRSFAQDLGLVGRHPTTDRYIPLLATHWSIQPDQKTVYYKLDPDVRWTDGKPLTADDYVFTFEMLQSEFIVDPFYNDYVQKYYESVVALDDRTLKIVGKFESWRPLDHFGIWPTPRHATKLGPDWVKDANNEFPVSYGPYVLSKAESGQYVEFKRLDKWWGDGKHYFRGMYNVERIHVKVIEDADRAFDFFIKGELSYYRVNTAKKWAEEMEFEAIKKGWAHRKRLFVDFPQGLYGFAMNLQKPIFRDKNFRKAIQHGFDFETINSKLMYSAYVRKCSVFEGTAFENPNLRNYEFDPRKVRQYLAAAGYTKRGRDGIFVDGHGRRASFTLNYGTKGLERHMTVIKQRYRKLGIELNLELLDPGTSFERGLERAYEMTILSRTSNFYPSPDQYFGSEFVPTTNNNNIWAYGTAYTDSLIKIYRDDLDADRRVRAMHELDAIISDEAFYVPFWDAPFIRFIYWDHVRWPEYFMPKRTEQFTDWQVFWVDEGQQKKLENAMKTGEAWPEDTVIDVDPYGIQSGMDTPAVDAAVPGGT
jgi:microcin C transport system substrate-binding protein